VGLAAIQIARALGATILATAGTEQKRILLQEMGIQHVFDSRSTEFAGKVLEATNGLGVDVVLNSLSGEAISAGLRCLAPYGRFVEIGKRDMWRDSKLGMKHFLGNRSFLAVDLAQMMVDRIETVAALMQVLRANVETGLIQAVPVQIFPVSKAAEAFQLMAKAGHIGKIVLDFSEPQALLQSQGCVLSAEGTYLITGGTGALGLESAKELVDLGARHLVLTTRGATPAHALPAIERMRDAGVEVHVSHVDVSVEAQVELMLQEVRASMPPLRGVIHAAGVLDDALATNLEARHFEAVMAGKTRGAIYLDRHTADCALDFFLLYSSVACVLGSPGQGNYAAANAALDALAIDRTTRGLRATSINWGPWSEVGLAAADGNRGKRFASKGLPSISPGEGRRLLPMILQQPERSNVIAARVDREGWCKAIPSAEKCPLLSDLSRHQKFTAREETSLVERLRAMTAQDAREALRVRLMQLVGDVLHVAPERVPLRKALRSAGLDSLMGLELRNKLELMLDLRLPASVIWNYPTIESLSAHLFERVGLRANGGKPGVSADPAEQSDPFHLLAREIEEAEEALAKDYA
jgi:epothilone polyketide synthase D